MKTAADKNVRLLDLASRVGQTAEGAVRLDATADFSAVQQAQLLPTQVVYNMAVGGTLTAQLYAMVA